MIALCIALETIAERVRGITEGFTLEWIRSQCLYWWERGFAESRSNEAFRALLDEMVGLGVLRPTGRDRYALRNPNVLTLLGTEKEIERDLEDAILKEPAPEYEPATFRRAGGGPAWTRSPLTALQESELLGRGHAIRVVFGLRASGLDRVPEYLTNPIAGAEGCVVERATDRESFSRELDRLVEKRATEMVVVVVPHTMPWDLGWLEAADEHLRKRKTRKSPIRVVFLADGELAWRLGDPAQVELDASFGTLSLTNWAPAALKRLMADLHHTESGWEELYRLTGGWSWFVERVAEDLVARPAPSIQTACERARREWGAKVRADLPASVQPCIRSVLDWAEAIDASELSELVDDRALASAFIEWGLRVGVLHARAGDMVALDPTIAAAMTG